METFPYWKKIWSTLIGQNKLTTETDINNVLKIVKKDICTGICIFKQFTKESFDEWKKTLNKSNENHPFEQFVKRLSQMLNLETVQAWKIFCNFLMYEYYGSITDIERTADVEMYNDSLFEQVWLFYSSERMYLIKAFKHIMESCLQEDHKFNALYMNFISFKYDEVRNYLFKQFEHLLKEITLESSSNCREFRDWVNRNQQEQFEVINCIILSEEFLPLDLSEFKALFNIFKTHNFTQDPVYYKILDVVNQDDLRRIRRLEVMALVIGLSPCWESTKPWDQHIEEIENLIMTAICEGDLCILLLTWATLQMTLPCKVAVEMFNVHYSKFTKAALKEKVFVLMYQILCDPIIQDSNMFKPIQKALYNLLDFICFKFDDQGSIIEHEGVVQLTAELIKNPELAEKFFHDRKTNANVIYNVLLEMFPCSFDSYSEVVLQLLKHEKLFPEVVKCLNSLEYFTEEYPFHAKDCVVTMQDAYNPCKCVRVNAGSQAIMFNQFGKCFMKYEADYTYFALAREKINKAIFNKENSQCHLRINELFYEIMEVVLKKSDTSPEYMNDALETVGNVLASVAKTPPINYKLMKICLDICVSQMENNYEDILEMLIAKNFLPYTTKNSKDLNNYFGKNFLNQNIILLSIQDQLSQGEYGILFSYINIIKATPKTTRNIVRIHIPGIVFLLMNFFPIHLDTSYKRINEKYELMQICLEYFFEILATLHNATEEYDKIIYNFCYELLINYEPSVSVFVRIFRTSNVYLHTRMLKEPNWNNGTTYTIINSVKITINILMRLFTLHNKNERSLLGTNLLNKFLDKNFTPSSLRLLIGYLNHAFDPAIPKISIQLLKKIAYNKFIPILALIEMDQYQIQSAILDKLRDPLEEESVKIAILELITLSIVNQNGLTVAFFDLRQQSSKKHGSAGDSIIAFMEEYLDNIKKSSTYLNSPVQSAVLDLFHTLWMYRKDILVEQLKQEESFWATLVDPLFQDLKLPNRTYTQIFNIITFELFKHKGTNDQINEIIYKLFNKDLKFVKVWCNHILSSLDENDVAMNTQSLLRSWKNLIMSVILIYPTCLEEVELQKLLTETALHGLVQHFKQPEDIRILTSCAEMYLLFIKHWPEMQKDRKDTFTILTKAFKYLGDYYYHMSTIFKEIMLTIAIKTIQDLSKLVTAYPALAEKYLYSIGGIFEKEFMKITSIDVEPTDGQVYNEWLLLLIFADNLISLNFVETHPTWFCLTQFVNKVVMSVGLFTSDPIYFPVAKVAVQCLLNFAKTNLYTEFINIDFEAFFDSTKPPKKFLCADISCFQNPIPWHFEEWWLIYTGLLKLMIILLKKIGARKLEIFFAYTSIHYEIIKSVLRLPKVTVDKTALHLTTSCFYFVYKLLPWRQEWKVTQTNIYSNIIATIYEAINGVTCIFIRPKILTFFTVDNDGKLCHVENIPTDLFVNTMNELMKIIGLCCLCLLRASPNLLSLMALPDQVSFINDVVIDYDFHIPRIYEENPRKITYGTVLSLTNFLCKTVTYINAQRVAPQKHSNRASEKSTTPKLFAFVYPDYTGGYSISEHHSSLSTEISNLSAPWLMKLNLSYVQSALEALGTIVATQVYIDFNMLHMKPDVKRHVKRELCSELMYFYEFVRKRFIDTSQHRKIENMVFRKYTPWKLPYAQNINESTVEISFVKKNAASDDEEYDPESVESFNDLDPNLFFSRDDFSNINPSGGAGDARMAISKIIRPLGRKPFYGEKLANSRVYRIPLDKVLLKYEELPAIKDTDYLLFLTHWFIFFCDLSQY